MKNRKPTSLLFQAFSLDSAQILVPDENNEIIISSLIGRELVPESFLSNVDNLKSFLLELFSPEYFLGDFKIVKIDSSGILFSVSLINPILINFSSGKLSVNTLSIYASLPELSGNNVLFNGRITDAFLNKKLVNLKKSLKLSLEKDTYIGESYLSLVDPPYMYGLLDEAVDYTPRGECHEKRESIVLFSYTSSLFDTTSEWEDWVRKEFLDSGMFAIKKVFSVIEKFLISSQYILKYELSKNNSVAEITFNRFVPIILFEKEVSGKKKKRQVVSYAKKIKFSVFIQPWYRDDKGTLILTGFNIEGDIEEINGVKTSLIQGNILYEKLLGKKK